MRLILMYPLSFAPSPWPRGHLLRSHSDRSFDEAAVNAQGLHYFLTLDGRPSLGIVHRASFSFYNRQR